MVQKILDTNSKHIYNCLYDNVIRSGEKMKKKFNVSLLYQVTHDNETMEIFERVNKGKRGSYVREAILKFANNAGFKLPKKEPNYMPPSKWQMIQDFQNTSRKVDYAFLIAYYWLKALPRYSYRGKSCLP
jgi:hypothetical protein